MKRFLFIAALLAGAACSKKSPPKINSFSADKTDITDGDTVSLSFDVTGATSLTINPTPGTVTTSPVAVTPHVSTVYTLRAANDAGADSKDVSINVKPMPTAAQISYFSALPSQVAPNGQVTLTWSVARATSIKIYDGTTTVDVTAASQLVVPQLAATTRYTMTVTGAAGTTPASVTATAVARVVALPQITFNASSTSINQGDKVILSWDGTATSWSLSDGTTATNYGPLKTATVEPAANVTYTLTGIGAIGSVSVTKSLSITVNPSQGTTLVYTAPTASATLKLVVTDACPNPCTSMIFRLVPATPVSLRGVALNIPLDAARVSLGGPATFGTFVTGTTPAAKIVIGTGPLKNTLVLGAALKGSGTAPAGDVSPPEVAHFTLTLNSTSGKGTVFDGTGAFLSIRSSASSPPPSSIAVGTLVVQ